MKGMHESFATQTPHLFVCVSEVKKVTVAIYEVLPADYLMPLKFTMPCGAICVLFLMIRCDMVCVLFLTIQYIRYSPVRYDTVG